jgi:hypothetical protein
MDLLFLSLAANRVLMRRAIQLSSRNRYANVTIFLRCRHLFVTPQCDDGRKQQDQQMNA